MGGGSAFKVSEGGASVVTEPAYSGAGMWTSPPKPYPACPKCTCIHVDCLESLSKRSDRDYLACVDCGHVWTIVRPPQQAACDFPEDSPIKRA